ncbi:MAG: Pantothenate kinase type III, CoaX-like [Ktedonobacterales bacterium]|jgi:type III pantothenate kinase|nr:MAG: Pantothenate kinase type III, CoaX-like [Ktedonobacterales bacterium]
MPQIGKTGERLLLAVDISNTGIKFGLYPLDSRELRARWRIATNREKTADEYAMLLAELCRHAGVSLEDISESIISSVVPPLTPVFQDMGLRYLGREPLLITHTLDLGVRLRVDNPWETGADRILSTLAAHTFYGGPAIVIQFGTATSFDCVSPEGDFLGGAIAPGLGISAEALARAASRLYQVELAPPPTALGTNTAHSMQSGIVYGHAGLVEGLVTRLRREIPGGERAHVIAHGGLAEVMAGVTPCIDTVDSNLLLNGLRIAYERLRPANESHKARHT